MLAGAAIALVRAWIDRDRLRLGLGAIALALMVAVALMTQAGFAGNLRYVALPAALVCVLAGAGWVELVRDAARRFGTAAGVALTLLICAASVPFVATTLDHFSHDMDVVRAESELYDRLPPIIAKAGGSEALLRCGRVYAPPFEVQAVAWAMHVHGEEVGIFASPPGTTIAGFFSALGRDPRFAEVTKNRRWVVASNCNGRSP